MIFYIIKHKSGQIMPEMKRGRGYTSWNPNSSNICHSVTNTPRLFKTKQEAKRSIDAWINFPNMEYTYYGDTIKVIHKNDGRTPFDLGIIKVSLRQIKSETLIY